MFKSGSSLKPVLIAESNGTELTFKYFTVTAHRSCIHRISTIDI